MVRLKLWLGEFKVVGRFERCGSVYRDWYLGVIFVVGYIM